jgi:iron complex outermembrane receptor protein
VDDPSLFTYAALGEADSAGFELDLTANFDGDFSLWASYAYVDAETSNDFFDPNFGAALPAGSALLNVPDQTLSLQLVKDMQVEEKELVLGGGLLYVSDRNGQFNNQDFNLPSYTTVQAFTSFQVTESINIRAEVQNLLDEEYYLNSFASIWVQPGTPRNFRLTVSLSL